MQMHCRCTRALQDIEDNLLLLIVTPLAKHSSFYSLFNINSLPFLSLKLILACFNKLHVIFAGSIAWLLQAFPLLTLTPVLLHRTK